MANAIQVSDSLSNREEHIEAAAKIVGTGAGRKIFEAIYFHKSRVKTVQHIADVTGLSRMRVLQVGRRFYLKGIVGQTEKDGDTAYQIIDFFQAHKKEVLGLAGNRKKIAAYPTKRKQRSGLPATISIPTALAGC